ncbi:MAG: T9SS type A sorting domain-containing protein, partial [bacterium]
MQKTLLNFYLPKKHFPVSCWLIFLFLIDHLCAETITVQGTVSVSTTTVKNAKVTFIALHDSTVQYSTFTDEVGNYQIEVMASSIEPSPEELPTKFELNQNYPNPFSSETSISYNLKQPLKVKVTIYDILGRVVRKFTIEKQQIGNNTILWEGKNHLGQRLPAGVYFYQVRAGDESQIKKMVLCGDGGMNLGPSPVSASPHFPQAHSETLVDLLEGYYHVRVENTDNTYPMIKNTTIEKQTVYDNTPLDLLVDSQYPIADADIYVDSTHQIIRGFGAANILQWRPDITDTEIETAFDNGIYQLGFTILRLRVQPQKELWFTNLPSAQKAHDMGAIIIAAPWNDPEEMLETVNGIQRVRHDMYEEYAAHLDSFVTYMNNNGVPLYGISVQNEPDIKGNWTSWTADEMLTFMKDYAHTITNTKVMAPESFNFSRSMSDPILKDSAA